MSRIPIVAISEYALKAILLRLQIILGAFGVRSCVLNATLPANCRAYTVSQFNDGKFSLVIASDASDIIGSANEPKDNKVALLVS